MPGATLIFRNLVKLSQHFQFWVSYTHTHIFVPLWVKFGMQEWNLALLIRAKFNTSLKQWTFGDFGPLLYAKFHPHKIMSNISQLLGKKLKISL